MRVWSLFTNQLATGKACLVCSTIRRKAARFRLLRKLPPKAHSNCYTTTAAHRPPYLALNNITLGYDLPKEVCESVGFSSLTFTLSGDNLWILTHRKGFNPTASEVGNSNRYQYAPLSTFTLGVRANF